jgi:hypothetical protein
VCRITGGRKVLREAWRADELGPLGVGWRVSRTGRRCPAFFQTVDAREATASGRACDLFDRRLVARANRRDPVYTPSSLCGRSDWSACFHPSAICSSPSCASEPSFPALELRIDGEGERARQTSAAISSALAIGLDRPPMFSGG